MKKPNLKSKISGEEYDEFEIEIMDFCMELMQRMLAKYRAGRKEHGGKPDLVNVQREINLEVLDILNYHLVDRVNVRAVMASRRKCST